MALTCGEGGSTGAEIVSTINNNTEAITAMTGFYHVTTVDALDLPESYTNVATLDVALMPAGIYVLNITSTYQLDLVNKSVFAQFSVNAGAPEEFRKEPKDNTDREAFSYAFPYTHTNTVDFHCSLDFRKEDANGTLDVLFANIWVERKANL